MAKIANNTLFRILLDYTDLADEIVEQLPEKYFISSTATFLDPAFGGGQLLMAVARRLRKYGHSKENILSRLYGWEDAILYITHKKNEWLKGAKLQVVKYEDFVNMENSDISFDVILGNPPFQARVKGDYSLWAKFIKKGIDSLKDGGCLAFITPQGFLSPTNDIRTGGRVNILNDYLSKYDTTILDLSSDVAKNFKGINSTFCYFMVVKRENRGKTKVITDTGETVVNLANIKYLPQGRVDRVSVGVFEKVTAHGEFMKWTHKAISGEQKIFSSEKSSTHTFPVVNGNSNKSDDLWWSDSKPQDFDIPKVIVPYYGSSFLFVFDEGNLGYGKSSVYYLSENENLKCVKKVLNSKLFRFLIPSTKEKYTQYNEPAYLNSLPKLDLSKEWSDDGLFKHFNLTQEEIDHIEETVSEK